MQNLETIDRKLGVIDKKINFLGRINPINARQECKKFFSAYHIGRVYNPIFNYKPLSPDLRLFKEDLSKLSIIVPPAKNERWFFSSQLESKRRRILEKISALSARGTESFHEYSKKLFGLPEELQIKFSYDELTQGTAQEFSLIKEDLSSKEAADIFALYIKKSALPWKITLRDNISSKAGLDARYKYLLIKNRERFSSKEVLSLIVHEIETHIYRRENGVMQKFPGLFGEGFAGPPTTEEGLAFFNEMRHNHDPRRLKIICARTVSVHIATKKSFFETFLSLVNYGIPPTYAWAITLRTKRGFCDTEKPGAFGKDHHYLRGYLEIKDFFNNNGNLEGLYIGKLNINNLESINALGIQIQKPKYLPGSLIDYDN